MGAFLRWGIERFLVKRSVLSDTCDVLLETERLLEKASRAKRIDNAQRLVQEAMRECHVARGLISKVIAEGGSHE